MSKDIYDISEDIQIFESGDIYSPFEDKIEGSLEGEQYEILVKDRSLPDGVPPSPAEIVEVIGWNQKFFMEWEIGGNPAVDITVKDGSTEVIRVEGYTEKSKIFDEQGLVNETQYDLQVIAEIYNYITKSNIKNVTLASRTPQNLSVLASGKDTVDLDWDDLTPSFESYTIYLKNIDTGLIEQKIAGIQGSATTVYGLKDQGNYECWVTAVSKRGIFESAESNHVTFVASNAPKNFSANIIDPTPDTPQNFSSTELPNHPINFTAEVDMPSAPTNFTTTKQ